MIFYKNRETFKPFQTNAPFLYLLKTSENQRFSDVLKGSRNGKLDWNELNSQFPKASSHKLRILQNERQKKILFSVLSKYIIPVPLKSCSDILMSLFYSFISLTINAALQLRFFKIFCLKAPFQTIQVFCLSLPENIFLKLE